jgi:uroporphyrinogen decarboxylase
VVSSSRFEPYPGEPDKDRLLNALKLRPVDRVPNWEVLIEDRHVEMILGKYAGNTLAYGSDPAKGPGSPEPGVEARPMHPGDFIDLCGAIGQDVMLFEGGFWTPFTRRGENGGVESAFDRSVKSRRDFERLVLDSQPRIDYAVRHIKEYGRALKARGSKAGVACGYGCIFQTLYEFVVGFDDFMVMCLEDRDLVEEMLEASTVHFTRLTRAMVEAGVDMVYPADDVAFKSGLFVRPELFREMWVPRMGRIIAPAVEAGVPVLFHSDGKIDDIVEDLVDMGVDGFFPMDPYCIDYRDYKKRFGGVLALAGNIDITFPLATGTPSDVERDVIAHMEVLKPGYGYIAGSSHSVVNYIPHGNFTAMINAIHRYGVY